MTPKNLLYCVIGGILAVILVCIIASGGSDINAVNSPFFTDDGHLKGDTTLVEDSLSIPCTEESQPTEIKLYVEVSGSMNGFFRPNLPTGFKKDVCSVFTFVGFSSISRGVNILSNDGEVTDNYSLDDYINYMNHGAFVSSAETKVPTMIESIIKDTDIEHGEVAVLVSDMKFSPEKAKDMGVQLTQYASRIRNIANSNDAAFCLIAATSNYLDKTGCSIADESPYYYFVIGKTSQVIWARNRINTLLEHNNSYVEDLEFGMRYNGIKYDFGMPLGCIRLIGEPTFYDVSGDECTIPIGIDITGYRWVLADEKVMEECLSFKSTTGSSVEIMSIEINDDHQHGKQMVRKATATVTIKVSNMLMDADVIEWTLAQPEEFVSSRFTAFYGAISENEYDKTFSLEEFVSGMNKGTNNLWSEEPQRILISKNS